MKRFFLVIILLFFCLPNVFAQTDDYDLAIAKAEQVKLQNGENSAEYIDALLEVCIAAVNKNDYDSAYSIWEKRQILIKNFCGEHSAQYAGGFCLGANILYDKGDISHAESLLKSGISIFEDIGVPENDLYQWGLLMYGRISFDDKKYQECISSMSKFSELTKEKTDTLDIKNWLLAESLIANSYNGLQDYENALKHYNNYLSKYNSAKLKSTYQNTWRCIWLIGFCYEKLGKYNDANKYREDLLAFIDAHEGSHCINYLDALYSLQNNLDVLQEYKKSLNIAKRISQLTVELYPEDSKDYTKHLDNLAWHYNKVGDAQNAIKYFEEELNNIISQNNNKIKSCYEDERYARVIETLSTQFYLDHDFNKALKYYNLRVDILQNNNCTNTEEYFDAITDVFDAYCRLGEYSKARKMIPELEVYARKYPESDAIDLFYSNCMDLYEVTGDFKKKEELNKHLKKNIKDIGNQEEEAFQLSSMIDHYIATNDIEKATKALSQAFNLADNVSEDYKNIYLAACYNQKGLIFTNTNPAEAMNAFLIAEELCNKEDDNEKYTILSNVLINKGAIQYNNGNLVEAIKTFENANSACKASGQSESSPNVLSILNNIALCNMLLGDYATTINIYEHVRDLIKRDYGTTSPLYLVALQNIGFYYLSVSQYDKAVNIYNEAIDLSKQLYGNEENTKSPLAYANLGFAYLCLEDFEMAERTLLKAADLTKVVYGETSENLAKIYTNLAFTESFLGNPELEINYFDLADNIYEANKLKNTLGYAGLLTAKGRALMIDANYDAKKKSIKYFDSALSLYKYLGVTNTIGYFHTLYLYGASSRFDGKPSEGFINEYLTSLQNLYENNIANFNEAERSSFMSQISDAPDILFSARLTDDVNIPLYDYILLSKGLLLTTSTNFTKAIMESGDSDLIAKYQQLRQLQMQIQKGGNVDELKTEASRLERELIVKSKDFADYAKWNRFEWTDVRDALKKNEVAIEFVKYNDFRDSTDRYVALVLKNGWSQPEFVELCDASQLPDMAKLGEGKAYDGYPAKQLYHGLFQPLEQYIKAGDNVYFSPASILHTLAIEALPNDAGKELGDVYNMYRVSSTKNVCIQGDPVKYKSAVVYGGLKYDVSPDMMATLSRAYSPDEFSQGYFASNVTRSGWAYLAGTKDEAERISSTMKAKKLSVNLYEGEQGNEESFKALSGSKNDIIHIATHGFFLPSTVSKERIAFEGVADDPMTRSGLMMAGGNYSWTGKGNIDNVEDGVLMASEIANLDFRNTDLVILSACETALGDVTDEGVFGLQRGFKNAGVQTIVMSLWKVDDEATSLMMTDFYRNLLSGKSKREAFNSAQKTVQKKYDDPYYWASFIMLD